MRRRSLPPRKICAGCGTVFYGYADHCQRCWKERAADRSALVGLVKEQRAARRQERVDGVEQRPAGSGFGEFPAGF